MGSCPRAKRSHQAGMVRAIYSSQTYREYQYGYTELFLLVQHLWRHRIHFTLEKGTDSVLEGIARSKNCSNLYLLIGFTEAQQTFIVKLGVAAVLLAEPSPGVLLPSVTVDTRAVLRHAVAYLLRHGFTDLKVLVHRQKTPSVGMIEQIVASACADWR